MAVIRPLLVAMAVMLAVLLSIVSPCVEAQSFAPAPAPTSDGTSIDQGVAYALMIVALLLTYLIHPLDAFPYGLF
ncbi:putative arabinogalactan protein/22/41 [Helianthus annuus]|nr:putative arabinogalactan protein/22/41 [Helianthus annuus]KAJ0590355.1 putative arabinogalactan protein/22/41 [Helianthus annuus]KAJ0598153.1 putative arabinogalactan protein/22/41 [Helianthus annuus]KAJ0758778.1 putative arabinogalactan protein/22/41 [Helianthus annuus]KAJ0762434.1 putative arabinogalactan protein/22/41 [Helianthus annuus]